MHIGTDVDAGTVDRGIGGATGMAITPRASVIDLWIAARRDLEAAGVVVVEVDFPAVSNYEADRRAVHRNSGSGVAGVPAR